MPSRVSGGRRRSIPHLLLGLLLIVLCVTGAVVVGMQMGHRITVLQLARPVIVGQVLSAKDFRSVDISADSSVDAITTDQASTVVGRPVAYALPAGALVTRAVLGSPQVPSAGTAIAALGLKTGQFPPGVTPGTRVFVLTTAAVSGASGSSAGGGLSWTAVVVDIAHQENDPITVLSLQLPQLDAKSLAVVPVSQLSVLTVAGSGQ